jgi:hypothetical protein
LDYLLETHVPLSWLPAFVVFGNVFGGFLKQVGFERRSDSQSSDADEPCEADEPADSYERLRSADPVAILPSRQNLRSLVGSDSAAGLNRSLTGGRLDQELSFND